MKITKSSLSAAVEQSIISAEQAEHLEAFLQNQPASGPRFDFTHVLYYMGGLISVAAMSLMMNIGWEAFGGFGIFFISVLYAGFGLKLVAAFQSRGYVVPAGIVAAFVVALSPLAIYGLQQGMGWWPDESTYQEYHRYVGWQWLYLEIGTLAVGVVIGWRYRYPFLVMPIAVTLWYLSMDMAAFLVGQRPDWELQALVSLYFGLIMMLVALWVDIRTRRGGDYAFWLYVFGVITFWGGLSMQTSDSELSKFLYVCTNVVLVAIGVLLVRRVFVVFGAMGCTYYLSYLAYTLFLDSWLFPIVLSALGLLIIFLGIKWQKHERSITQWAHRLLPAELRELLEARR